MKYRMGFIFVLLFCSCKAQESATADLLNNKPHVTILIDKDRISINEEVRLICKLHGIQDSIEMKSVRVSVDKTVTVNGVCAYDKNNVFMSGKYCTVGGGSTPSITISDGDVIYNGMVTFGLQGEYNIAFKVAIDIDGKYPSLDMVSNKVRFLVH